jgi:hypothetical protein
LEILIKFSINQLSLGYSQVGPGLKNCDRKSNVVIVDS